MRYHPTLYAGMQAYPGVRLRRLVGRGGFAEVWEAETASGERTALKFIRCDDGRAAQREIRALQAILQVNHPCLVRVERIWSYLTYLVIGMELADCSLTDVLVSHQEKFGTALAAEDACEVLAPVAKALDFLNARRHRIDGQLIAIQHCDVKPSNLLVFGNRVKVADFGLSAQTAMNVQTHRRQGTPDYAAPEVFQGRLSDRTDQYSLAITYYQLRTGQLPFSDSSAMFRPRYIRRQPELDQLEPWERPPLERALSAVPQQRWPSCRAFLSQLSEVTV